MAAAYRAAAPGDVTTLASANLRLAAAQVRRVEDLFTDVVFPPAAAATVTINGDLDSLGAKHITIKNVKVTSWIFANPAERQLGGPG